MSATALWTKRREYLTDEYLRSLTPTNVTHLVWELLADGSRQADLLDDARTAISSIDKEWDGTKRTAFDAAHRYQIQLLKTPRGFVDHRITDMLSDSRVATCYMEHNARLVCDALNAADMDSLRSRLARYECEHGVRKERVSLAEDCLQCAKGGGG